MAYQGPGNSNGAQTGPIPPAQPSGQQARFCRPFTLQEALPFSPFTSVIPFESDIIPTPDLGAGPSSSNLADLVPVHDFENLNKEAGGSSSTSRRLEQTLEHVQNLLNPSRLTKINFKTGAKVSISSNPTNSLATHLSPFSKMVLDRTAVPYRYPTPDTPGAAAAASSSNSEYPTPQQPTKKHPKPAKVRRESAAAEQVKISKEHEMTKIETPERSEPKFAVFIPTKKQYEAANSAIAASDAPQTSTLAQQLPPETPASTVVPNAAATAPSRSPSQPHQSAQKPAIISIELAPTSSFKKSEYMVVNDEVDEPSNLSMRKRKRDDYDESQDVYRDQKQKADNAFHALRRCFLEIFDAEDNVAATQSGSNPLVFLNSQQEPAMTTAAHQKVQPLLQNAITLRCFAYVPVDELLRIQRLSDAALKQVQDQDIRIDETWSGTDALPWAQQLSDVDNALRGARTVLRIMSAGREDKQLYSEDLIQDCLRLFRDVADGIVVPLTEKVRRYGMSGEKNGKDSSKGLFDSLIPHKKPAGSIFTSFTRLYSVFTTLISNIDLSESVVTALETISSNLIFTENAFTDRDSVVGVQKFDGIRLVAMDMLSQIFLKNSQSRLGIVDDILLQLEKIPQAKQKARQFKLTDGRSIQPVSALILRLVQTSAGKVADVRSAQSKLLRTLDDGAASNDTNEHSLVAAKVSSFQDEDRAAEQAGRAIAELQSTATSLASASRDTAAHVIGFMVGRAIKSTKTGESPFRRILENFLEDLTTCLESPDWPASELLLRLLMASMMSLVDGERTAAPAKNMALEILGTMGAAISKLRSLVRKTVNSLDSVETTELGSYLSELAAAALEFNSRPEQMVSWSGPYRASLEYLDQRCSEDPHLSSAVSFLVTDWANKVSNTFDAFQDDDDERDQEFGRLAYRLRMMIEDRRWLSSEYSFAAVPSSLAKLSYHIMVIRSQFCEAYRHLLNILLRFMTIDQATVRSKSLKSVNDVLETDPTILDGDSTVMQLIVQCSTDSSPQVRDSALGLIGKCIGMRPTLEKGMIPSIIARFSDAGVGVRKRAMKLARDIYLRNFDRNDRSVIANGLLLRVQDPDEGVREVARQMIEEIWIAPYYSADSSAVSKTALADHVALMIQTVTSGTVSNVLDKVFQAIIGSKEANFKVGQMLVASMFDLIDNPDSEDPSIPSGRDALQFLMVLATADAKLFTFEQIKLLQPKVASIGSGNVDVSKAVMTIYRRVLPQLSKVYDQFLTEVRAALLPAIAKYPRSLLDDVAACLWIICGLLGSTEPLSRLLISVLRGMSGLREKQRSKTLDDKGMNAFKAYALIAGMLGHHCDLDDKLDAYKQLFPTFKGNSVSRLIVELIIPFAQPTLPMDVRKAALDAAGLVCQAWPRNFAAANVYTTFQQVFDEEAAELEWMILRSLKGFLFTEERRSEQAASEGAPQNEQGQKLNLKVMGGTTFDDVSSATTQRFLKDITRIALSSQNDHAFQAVEVLASINRQGLVHPKETGVTLITLETSSTSRISELAFSEHRALHDKHETVLEREYIKAVHSAFVYQRDIVGDYRGATVEPFTSKLHLMIEVLKSSKAKNRMKFFEKLCAQVDFEPAKLDSSGVMPDHVQFSQFIIENLAFFDYASVHELLHTVTTMEKLVTSTGASVAQAIEAEIFQVTMDAVTNSQAGTNGENGGPMFAPAAPPIDSRRLRQLTAGSMILQSVWEARTYLRRQFNLGTNRRDGKLKTASKEKEAQKPVKVQTVTGDKFWDDVAMIMTALSSQSRMMEQCRSFVDLLNVDREFKVADEEDDDMNDEDPATPSGDEDDDEDMVADRGRKRKSTATPRKKRPRSSSQPRKRGRPRKNPQSRDDEEEDMAFF